MKLAVLLLVVGLFQVVYSNKEGDDHVVMFLEMAQEVAEEKKHIETTPIHILEALIRNSRIHNALPKEDSIDLEEFLYSALRKLPKRQEEEDEEGVSISLPPFSYEASSVISAARALGKEEDSQTEPYHLYEALFECDTLVTAITDQFFDTTVVDHSRKLMEKRGGMRREKEVGECGGEEVVGEGEEKEEKEGRKGEKEEKEGGRRGREEVKTPGWLEEKIGEGSGWGMFLNTTYVQTLPSFVINFGFDVLESFPKNSIIILTGQPLYQLFLELPNIVRKEILEIKKKHHHLTNTADMRGLRGDVYPIYTGYLKDENFAEKKSTLFPKISFPAHLYSPNERKENTYDLAEFLSANYDDLNIFFATDPVEDQEGVWEDLLWLKDYALIPHGFYHKLVKKSEMEETDWYRPHIAAVAEMTKKVDIKSQKDETIKGAFWNIIRLLHQKVISSIKDEKSLEHSEAQKRFTKFFRKLLKKSDSDEFVPLDILYTQCLSYMKWVYPEIGGEGLPDPMRFRKSRKAIEYVIKRYQAHPQYDNSDPTAMETIRSFEEYLEVTEKAIKEWEQMSGMGQ